MSRRGGYRAAAIACVLAGVLALPALAAPPGSVPSRFVGVNVDGPMYPATASGVSLAKQMALMSRTGVRSIRVAFDWAYAQPYAAWSDVPSADRGRYRMVGGIPTDFAQMDRIVGLAAAHELAILPVVLYAPPWDVDFDGAQSYGQPARDAPYAAFLTDLVDRYGPHGSFWRKRSGAHLPIRQWQIWNEPDITGYWPTQPFAPSYVALLAAAHAAIKQADPGAEVVLGGLVNFSWLELKSIYAVPGARGDFDVVAVHPYTGQPANVIKILQLVRQVMDANGDSATPILADEVSWTSAGGLSDVVGSRFDISTTPQGQAADIAALLPMLAADRHALGLAGFYYYTWAGNETPSAGTFGYSGLLKYAGGRLTEKPAFAAFAGAVDAMER